MRQKLFSVLLVQISRRPGRDADHTPPSSAAVKKALIYTSTHPVGLPGPVTGFPLPFVQLSMSSSKKHVNEEKSVALRKRRCINRQRCSSEMVVLIYQTTPRHTIVCHLHIHNINIVIFST